jgi:hypothetical protein
LSGTDGIWSLPSGRQNGSMTADLSSGVGNGNEHVAEASLNTKFERLMAHRDSVGVSREMDVSSLCSNPNVSQQIENWSHIKGKLLPLKKNLSLRSYKKSVLKKSTDRESTAKSIQVFQPSIS